MGKKKWPSVEAGEKIVKYDTCSSCGKPIDGAPRKCQGCGELYCQHCGHELFVRGLCEYCQGEAQR